LSSITDETAALNPPIEINAPSTWDLMRAMLHRLGRRFSRPPSDARRDAIILDAAVALRSGQYERAASILSPFRSVLACDPAYLNLMGVICELEGRWKPAARFYGLAISMDPQYEPARHNMQRVYELNTFGRTERAVRLGDTELRSCRQVPAPK